MADKTIAIKVKIEGTEAQTKSLSKFQTEIDKLTRQRKALNDAVKEGTKTEAEASEERAKLNLQIKANRNALRDVEAQILKENDALRKNSGFVEGIKIALKELQQEEGRLIKKQDALNKELKEATKEYGSNSKEVTKIKNEYNTVSKTVKKVKNDIKNFNTTVNNSSKTINNNTNIVNKLGFSFKKLGTSISGAFVGLFAVQKFFQVVSDGIKTISEFEQQMANVKAVTGATASEFAQLEKLAKDLGASTQFTATEVAQLEEEYAKLGFTTDEILDAAEATLELATATGSDLAQSAKVAAATLNGFGLEAEETQRVVDVMAKSFTSSALDINKFEVAMRQVAPVAKDAGLSIEETTAFLGILADNGIKAETAGTGLRNIFLTLAEKGMTLNEAMSMVANSTNSSATASNLFGKENAVVATTLAKTSDKAADFTRELRNAQGAASAMARIVGDTLEGDVKRLNSAWEGLVLNLGENGESLFRDIIQGATDFISTLGDLTKNTHAESQAMEQQRVKINVLVGRIANLNEGTDERKRLINELNIISPKFLEGLDKENLSNKVLAKRLKEVNEQLVNQILLKRKQEKIDEQAEEQADALVSLDEAKNNLEQQLLKTREAGFKNISKENDLNKTSIEQAKELLAILKEQEVRVRTTTQFGAVIESTNEQAKAYDRLSTAINQVSVAEKQKAKEDQVGIDLAKEKDKFIKDNNLNQEEATDSVEDNTKAVEKNNKAIKQSGIDLALINEELEELEDPFGTEDVDDFEKNYGKKTDAIDKFTEAIKGQVDAEEKLEKVIGEQQLEKVTGDIAKRDKDIEDELAFQQQLKQLKVDFAAETAEALVGVAGNRIERQKTLELDALNAQLENELISQEEFEKKREAIERKAFNKQKRLQIAQVAISLATELANIAANSAGNPLNAFTAGTAGAAQNIALAKIAIARSAVQTGIIASQQFAEGGFTGDGFGSPDSTGFKPAGVVHEGEYVVPKRVLESQKGGRLVGALESMRLNKPTPLSSIGFANGGFTGGASSMDLTGLRNEITMAVRDSIGAIQVVNNSTDTITEAVRVQNIQSEATFG